VKLPRFWTARTEPDGLTIDVPLDPLRGDGIEFIWGWLEDRGWARMETYPGGGTCRNHVKPEGVDQYACQMVSDLFDRIYTEIRRRPVWASGSMGTIEIRALLIAMLHNREDGPMVIRQMIEESRDSGSWTECARWLFAWWERRTVRA